MATRKTIKSRRRKSRRGGMFGMFRKKSKEPLPNPFEKQMSNLQKMQNDYNDQVFTTADFEKKISEEGYKSFVKWCKDKVFHVYRENKLYNGNISRKGTNFYISFRDIGGTSYMKLVDDDTIHSGRSKSINSERLKKIVNTRKEKLKLESIRYSDYTPNKVSNALKEKFKINHETNEGLENLLESKNVNEKFKPELNEIREVLKSEISEKETANENEKNLKRLIELQYR